MSKLNFGYCEKHRELKTIFFCWKCIKSISDELEETKVKLAEMKIRYGKMCILNAGAGKKIVRLESQLCTKNSEIEQLKILNNIGKAMQDACEDCRKEPECNEN